MIVAIKNKQCYSSAFDFAHRYLTREQLIDFYFRNQQDIDAKALEIEDKDEFADFIIEFLFSYGWSDEEFIEEALTRIDKKFIYHYNNSNETFDISEVE